MKQISFTVLGAEYEWPEDFDKGTIKEPIAFLKKNIVCPLVFENFESEDLEKIF